MPLIITCFPLFLSVHSISNVSQSVVTLPSVINHCTPNTTLVFGISTTKKWSVTVYVPMGIANVGTYLMHCMVLALGTNTENPSKLSISMLLLCTSWALMKL